MKLSIKWLRHIGWIMVGMIACMVQAQQTDSTMTNGILLRNERQMPYMIADKETMVMYMDKQSPFVRMNVFMDGRYFGTLMPGRYVFAPACEGAHHFNLVWHQQDANAATVIKKKELKRISQAGRIAVYQIASDPEGNAMLNDVKFDFFKNIYEKEVLEQTYLLSRVKSNCD